MNRKRTPFSPLPPNHTLVVGGGIAGLSAAALLATKGIPTTLIERSTTLGGRGASHEQSGFLLNQGAHALYRRGEALRCFHTLGLNISGRSPAPNAQFMRNGTLYTLRELFFGKKALLSLSEAWQLTRLLTKIFTSQHTNCDHIPLEQWLQSHTPTNAHTLRELLMLLVRLTNYANAPAQQSAGAALRQLKNGILGNVLYLDGGWQSIVEQLAATITQHNGTILQKTALQELTFANGQVTGAVTKHGQHIPAQHVILALPPKQAMAFLPQPAATALQKQHEQSIPVYTSCLDVVLKQLPNPSIRNVQGLSSPTYFSVHSAYANLQTTATSGEVVHLMKYQPEGQPIDEQATKQELLQKLSQLQPGWEKSCLYQRFLPKMVVTHAAVTPERIAQGPLLLQSKHEANGIHLVGAWNEPRAMLLDGAVASALRATDAITARQTLPLPINQDIP